MPMNDPKLDDAMSEFKEKIINRQRQETPPYILEMGENSKNIEQKSKILKQEEAKANRKKYRTQKH